eukprot:Nitzschia sp. Nitz4//scaffold136_size62208//27086//27604//NITZ4_006367-RA/size62208-processed-gene-0.36-mRNA-1//-1//CDS//3329535615//1514//frame0
MATEIDHLSSSNNQEHGANSNTHDPWDFWFHALHWLDILLATTLILLLFLTDAYARFPPASLSISVALLVLLIARGVLAQTTPGIGLRLSFTTSALFTIIYFGLAIVLFVNIRRTKGVYIFSPSQGPAWLTLAAARLEYYRSKKVHERWILMQKKENLEQGIVTNIIPEEGV